ncbi:MAG: (d)CMP kinase [Prevotellaceae bacterium]|jgi:cytidylate kinase|nr:(d)CMP kinase [Prevotellaceae bacterium]
MPKDRIIIAVDGHSSTGKSTFAKAIATKLGFTYIDSGALYRTITLFALEQGFIQNGQIDQPALEANLPSLKLSLNETDASVKIRSLKVSEWVSHLSALPFVREYVNNILREWGKENNIVMDGRDIGTVVFPEAKLKIFMTASPEIRAQRRYNELIKKGERPQYQEILENIQKRDYLDQHRAHSPLRRDPDALLLDNSNMNPQQQMVWLESIIAERLG